MRIICHIGFPKSGSTSLQLAIKESRDVNVFDWYRNPELRYAFIHICSAYKIAYQEKNCKAIIEKYLDRIPDRSKPLIVSWEGFVHPTAFRVDFDVVLTRLKKIFGDDIEFVIIFREQWSFLRSLYANLLVEGAKISFTQFLQISFIRSDESILSHLNYAALVSELREVTEKYHYFFLEDLSRKDGFQKLYDTLGIGDLKHFPRENSRKRHVDRQKMKTGFYSSGGLHSKRFDHERAAYLVHSLGKTDPIREMVDIVRFDFKNFQYNHNFVIVNEPDDKTTDAAVDEIKDVFEVENDALRAILESTFRKWNREFSLREDINLKQLGYMVD